MKTRIFCLLLSCLSMVFVSGELKATTNSSKNHSSAEATEAKNLVNRLQEIKTLSGSDLTPDEKKALKKEVRSIENKLKVLSGGIYISVGTLILILILLIILV